MTSTQAAKYLGVSYAIMKAIVYRGLVAYKKTPGGHYRFDKADLDQYLQNHYKKEWASE